jgi:hypothetical protein
MWLPSTGSTLSSARTWTTGCATPVSGTAIVLGVATHCCVDATARNAYFLDYHVVFGSDLTGGPTRP